MGVGAGMFDGLVTMFMWAMVGVFMLGVAVAVFIVYAVPWLWHIAKPIIHAWTAIS